MKQSNIFKPTLKFNQKTSVSNVNVSNDTVLMCCTVMLTILYIYYTIVCAVMYIAGCALNARPLAPGDWDFLWATGSCFTGRPRGDRIL